MYSVLRTMDDKKLLELAKELCHRDYETLGISLGIPYPELEKILIRKLNDYTAAFMHILHDWISSQKTDNRDVRLVLGEKLIEAKLAKLGYEMIDIVVDEFRNKVQKCEKDITDASSSWQQYEAKLHQSQEEITKHFDDIRDKIIVSLGKEIERITQHEKEQVVSIDKQAEEKIREIRADRETRLKQCHEDADKHRQQIECRRRELLDDVTAISDKSETEIRGLIGDARYVMESIEGASKKIRILLADNKELLEGAQELYTSVNDNLGKTNLVEHLTRTVKGVQFIEGMENGKYNWRIAGYAGKWELSSTAEIPKYIRGPIITGCTSKDDIIVTDVLKGRFHTYCLNVSNNDTQKVITSDGRTYVLSCALLNEDTIVCGKFIDRCTGDDLSECVRLYNRNWQHIRDIAVPKNTSTDHTWVYVDVDRDGMIVVAEYNQHIIYVVNPADGSIVNTLTYREDIGVLRGVLSTRDLIIQPWPCNNKLLIIDMQGAQREITHSGKILNCCIDTLTDDLYVVYWDGRREMAVVDQLFGEGHQEKVEVGSFRIKDNWDPAILLNYSCPIVTTLGEIIVSDGRDCHTLKKSFSK